MCQHCSTKVDVVDNKKDFRAKFCSKSCSATYHNLRRERKWSHLACLNCGGTGNNYGGKSKFCSLDCSASHKSKELVENWLSGKESGSQKNGGPKGSIRKYILGKANSACSECGWN